MTDQFKVNFMIVGAQKCGTSTLSEMLRLHPTLVRCDTKEPDFFSGCADWRTELSRYEQMFRRRQGALYYEASPSYTFYPHRKLELWNDLYDYNPALKVIYLVRDPIERVTSGYMHSYERGYTDLPFERALVETALFLDITRYATQITPFIERFGRARVHIIFFEDLVRTPDKILRELASFLGIDASRFGDVSSIHANASVGGHKLHYKFDNPGIVLSRVRRSAPRLWEAITDNSARRFERKPILPPAHRRAVLQMMRTEIDRLEAITGRNLSHWREDAAVVDTSPDPVGPV